MNEKLCNCPNQISGRDFVREIEYLRNVAPVIEAGKQKRETISHACNVIPNSVINLGYGLAIAGIGICVTYIGIASAYDYVEAKIEKKRKKKLEE